jgi:methionine-rich copper-binding protein CopC
MRTQIFVLSLLLVGLGGANAHAHAMFSSASPPVGGSVGAAPHQVALSFTQGLEPSFSSVQVRYRQSPSQRQYDECRSESVVRWDLQGELACALGRHSQDARKLLVPCRSVIGPG